MGAREDWIRSMGGNPARYRDLELPPLMTTHPDDDFIEARCPGRSRARGRRAPDALQVRATGAASFGGGQPDRAESSRCPSTRAKVLVRRSGRVRGFTLACTTCGHTWDLNY